MDNEDGDGRSRWPRLLLRRPRDLLLGVVVAGISGAICVNALYLQPGPHPAPIFSVRPATPPVPMSPASAVVVPREATGAVTLLPRPRPAEADAARPAASGRQSAAGAPMRSDPIGDLLSRVSSTESARPVAPQAAPPVRLASAPLPAPVLASAPAPSAPSVENVQRALRDFGYGQIKTTGVYDSETRAAVEQFERHRGLPVTGQLGDRTVRELDKVAGPLN